MRFLLWTLIVFPLGFALGVLSVANRHSVRLVLDPIASDTPNSSLEAPFFVYLFAALLIGLVLGGVGTWLGQGKWRRTARALRREAAQLHKETDRLNRELETTTTPRLADSAASDG